MLPIVAECEPQEAGGAALVVWLFLIVFAILIAVDALLTAVALYAALNKDEREAALARRIKGMTTQLETVAEELARATTLAAKRHMTTPLVSVVHGG